MGHKKKNIKCKHLVGGDYLGNDLFVAKICIKNFSAIYSPNCDKCKYDKLKKNRKNKLNKILR